MLLRIAGLMTWDMLAGGSSGKEADFGLLISERDLIGEWRI